MPRYITYPRTSNPQGTLIFLPPRENGKMKQRNIFLFKYHNLIGSCKSYYSATSWEMYGRYFRACHERTKHLSVTKQCVHYQKPRRPWLECLPPIKNNCRMMLNYLEENCRQRVFRLKGYGHP